MVEGDTVKLRRDHCQGETERKSECGQGSCIEGEGWKVHGQVPPSGPTPHDAPRSQGSSERGRLSNRETTPPAVAATNAYGSIDHRPLGGNEMSEADPVELIALRSTTLVLTALRIANILRFGQVNCT